MVQRESILTVADNSGAKKVRIIGIPGYSHRKFASVGEIVTVAVQDAIPRANVKKHDKVKAVIVRTRKEIRRDGGSYIRFSDNACVVIDNKKAPIGTRVFGPVARELKTKGFQKIVSLAPEVL